MPKRRQMMFIDGENLVMRYQAMLKENAIPVSSLRHIQDTFVWRDNVITNGDYDVLRATYYTYAVGDDERVQQVIDTIKASSFLTQYTMSLPKNLTPVVFRKRKQDAKRKGVDIQLTVDMLSHVYNNNVDSVFLITGDGDYEPLLREVIRCGKQVYLAALSSGLNQKLVNLADHFYSLDGYFFATPK